MKKQNLIFGIGLGLFLMLSLAAQAQVKYEWKIASLTSLDHTAIEINYTSPNQYNGNTAWRYPVWVNVTLPSGRCNGPVSAQLTQTQDVGGGYTVVNGYPRLELKADPTKPCHFSAPFPDKITTANHAGIRKNMIAIKVGSTENWLIDDAHKNDPSETARHNFEFSFNQ